MGTIEWSDASAGARLSCGRRSMEKERGYKTDNKGFGAVLADLY